MRFLSPLFVLSLALPLTFSLLTPEEQAFQDWENPAVFERNQEPTHVPLMPYPDLDSALTDRWERSPFYRSLNGTWKFHWASSPAQAPDDFHNPNFDASAWADLTVPGNWQMQGFGHPVFRNVAQPFPSDPPRVPADDNPIGSYHRTFELPDSWRERQVFLHFEGIQSASWAWVNGRPVGYNEGGMEPAEYNITPFLREGSNLLAVRVLRYSDGSYLDDQDMWRLSGIFRDVYLFSAPPVHIRDYSVWTDLDDSYTDATLHLRAEVKNYLAGSPARVGLRVTLLDPSGRAVFRDELAATPSLEGGEVLEVGFRRDVAGPEKWSAEVPALYTLILELEADDGTPLEYLSEQIGFREVEIVDRAILLNGVPVKFNGVNRHEHHPEFGKSLTAETMRKDLELMKQFNINLVRTSHYPPDPEFLDLADKYGIYVVDETGDEAHSNPHLSEDPAWREVYLNRARRLVLRDRNHPSVIMWSAGNESGTGQNLADLVREGKRLDPAGRPWMYGATSTTPDQTFEEVIGPRYPHPSKLERVGKESPEKDSRPSFMDEYIAATGNSLGHFQEYWDLIDRYPRLSGGAIWDWISPGITQPLVVTTDSGPFGIHAALMGGAQLVQGRFGRAVHLNGHDQWVELYRDPGLDATPEGLTLSAWIYPGKWNGTGAFITKGHQYGLQQTNEQTLEFYLLGHQRISVEATLPAAWTDNWHSVAGVFDGASLKLFVDGQLIAERSYRGRIRPTSHPVNIGKNAGVHGQNHAGYLTRGRIDQVRIYHRAWSQEEVRRSSSGAPVSEEGNVLWLDFETVQEQGKFLSLGIGARAYGLVWPDRRVQPELWQVKKTPQPVKVQAVDLAKGLVRLVNRHDFLDLEALRTIWKLTEDDRVLQQGELSLQIPPAESREVLVPFAIPELKAGRNYHLLLSFQIREAVPWAPLGHEVAWEQLELPFEVPAPDPIDRTSVPELSLEDDGDLIEIAGEDFVYRFKRSLAMITSLQFQGKELIHQGPLLNVWRAPTSNETDEWRNPPIATQWHEIGLDRLIRRVLNVSVERISTGQIIVTTKSTAWAEGAPAGFESICKYAFLGTGEVLLEHLLVPRGQFPDWLPSIEMWLPKVGLQMELSSELSRVSWYGRGPFETYPDRKTGAKIGLYSLASSEFYEPYLVPQDYGNRTDVRWASLVREDGIGLFIGGDEVFHFSVHPFDTDNLARALYPFQLKPSDGLILNIDHQVTGVGGTPVPTLEKYRVVPHPYRYSIRLSPFAESQITALQLSRRKVAE